MKIAIAGPNLNDQSQGEYHIHAAGCGDLKRGAKREPEYGRPWIIEADSREQIADAIFGDIIDENDGEAADYIGQCKFFDCCSALT